MANVTNRQIRIYEPALCCASGVCGTDVNQELVNFTADLAYLKESGADIERYNLASAPEEFATNATVVAFMQVAGADGLPLVTVDGVTVLTGRYPTRAELEAFVNSATPQPGATKVDLGLTPATSSGCCCGSECC